MPAPRQSLRPSAWRILLSLAVLGALIYLVVAHFGETERFVALLQQAQPAWLIVALLLQAATYLCLALIWRIVGAASEVRFSLPVLMRLALEKFSLDQVLPVGGMTGNWVVLTALQRRGYPASLSAEMFITDIISRCVAFGCAGILTILGLWLEGRLSYWSGLGIGLLSVGLLLVVPAVRIAAQRATTRSGRTLLRFGLLRRLTGMLDGISPERVLATRLMLPASLLQLAIMLLDAATLWVSIVALGHRATALAVLVGFSAATLSGIITVLPADLGAFEAVCTASLSLLGVPVEAALTGTLLLRGFTLWLPLVPGVILARIELALPVGSGEGAAR